MPGNDHPSLDIVSTHGTELAGKRMVLCVAGSVAAYKAIELARLLMRHGADVTCAASSAAARLIRPDYLKWASGNKVITKLSGQLEHIRLADYGRSDLIIVYPATAKHAWKAGKWHGRHPDIDHTDCRVWRRDSNSDVSGYAQRHV